MYKNLIYPELNAERFRHLPEGHITACCDMTEKGGRTRIEKQQEINEV